MPRWASILVMKSSPASLAQTQFAQLLDRVTQDRERCVVTQNGEAHAVILGIEDFLALAVPTPPSLAVLQEQATHSGTDTLTLAEIAAEIETVRRRGGGT